MANFLTEKPVFGIWKDRQNIGDAVEYVNRSRKHRRQRAKRRRYNATLTEMHAAAFHPELCARSIPEPVVVGHEKMGQK